MMTLRLTSVLLCGGLLAFVISGCGEKIKPSILPGIDTRNLPQQESWNSVVVISDSGRVLARIHAGYIRKYDSPQETMMNQGVVVFFYNENGKHTTTLTADSGMVNEQSYDLEADGNVLVVSDDSTRLRSKRLFWDNKRHLIHTPDYVYVTSLREKVQGQGFESDQRLRNYRIFKVTAQVRAD